MFRGLAWRSLLPVWLPAVALFAVALSVYAWQTSETLGLQAQQRSDLEELQSGTLEIRRLCGLATAEREALTELDVDVEVLYEDVFGSLEERLTSIMRAVGRATREAGLMPERFGYDADEDKKLRLTEFGVTFSVNGTYPQVRTMLGALQSSPEFLIVDRINFSGEEGTASRTLRISVHLTTYLASADEELLRRLTGGAGIKGGGGDGED